MIKQAFTFQNYFRNIFQKADTTYLEANAEKVGYNKKCHSPMMHAGMQDVTYIISTASCVTTSV
jgi:hypothetical protein